MKEEEGTESRGETSGERYSLFFFFFLDTLSWQDEWKIKLQNERLLKRAVPSLLPAQTNLYLWN